MPAETLPIVVLAISLITLMIVGILIVWTNLKERLPLSINPTGLIANFYQSALALFSACAILELDTVLGAFLLGFPLERANDQTRVRLVA